MSLPPVTGPAAVPGMVAALLASRPAVTVTGTAGEGAAMTPVPTGWAMVPDSATLREVTPMGVADPANLNHDLNQGSQDRRKQQRTTPRLTRLGSSEDHERWAAVLSTSDTGMLSGHPCNAV